MEYETSFRADQLSRWRHPVGQTMLPGVEVVEILKSTNDELEYIVAPRHVERRGDTLNCQSP